MIRSAIAIALATTAAASYAGDKVNFEKDLWPILHDKCVSCHRAPYEKRGRTKDPKGELRLDDKELFLKGGEDGKVVVPGKPDESPLYKLTMLPEDHDDFMPPKGDPLTDAEKATLKKWIEEGCDFGSWTKGEYKED